MSALRTWRQVGLTIVALLCVAMFVLMVFALFTSLSAKANAATHRLHQPSAAVQIPEAAAMYRLWVEQASSEAWGVNGSPARLAAQAHQESHWKPRARSEVGAQGLTQFMPATSKWIAQRFPDRLGQFDPWDPRQSLLAAATYDQWLMQRNPGATECDSWAFALSAYNGGETRLHREQQRTDIEGGDPQRWFHQVSARRARGQAFWRQNRGYVQIILITLEPAYIAAGWPGKAACA